MSAAQAPKSRSANDQGRTVPTCSQQMTPTTFPSRITGDAISDSMPLTSR